MYSVGLGPRYKVYYQYFLWFSLPVFTAISGLEVWYRTFSKLHICLLFFPPSQSGKNQVNGCSEGLQRQIKMSVLSLPLSLGNFVHIRGQEFLNNSCSPTSHLRCRVKQQSGAGTMCFTFPCFQVLDRVFVQKGEDFDPILP